MTVSGPLQRLAQSLLDLHFSHGGPAAARAAFTTLASLACSNHLIEASGSPEYVVSLIMSALTDATQAAECRVLFQAPDGVFMRVRQDGSPGAEAPLASLTGIAAEVLQTGNARNCGPDELHDAAPASDWLGARPPMSLLCAPLPDSAGVLQLFDNAHGRFTDDDLAAATEAATNIAAVLDVAGEGMMLRQIAPAQKARTGPDALLARIVAVALRVLSADRCWILIQDAAEPGVLRSVLDGQFGGFELRVSAHRGVAGRGFGTGLLVNIGDAYQDPRFNPALDRALGYRTQTLLCVPVETGEGRRLGVLQFVNRLGGPFTTADEENARAFAAQIAVTLEYSELFEEVSRMKAANETMLRNLSDGVLTLDAAGTVAFVNDAALRILRAEERGVLGRRLDGVFDELNGWLVEAVQEAQAGAAERRMPESELYLAHTDEWVPVSLSILPLRDSRSQSVGTMLVLDDLQREQELRRTMSRYVSGDIVEQLLSGNAALLNGATQQATILFSDIRGFSQISEALGPERTVAMLNQYFSYMEDVVTNRAGLVDKYIGDAVMAVFGVPFTTDADSDNAVQAATDMLQALALFNAARLASGEAALRIGIGLATGPVLMGNIGSPKRLDFTVIGDTVNLSSRLEGATKLYGADILLDRPTAARLRPDRLIRRLDVVRVLGQAQPTEVLEVLDGRRTQWGDKFEPAMVDYETGLDRYIAGDWSGALARFSAALEANPADKAAHVLRERCTRFMTEPPINWDGVFSLTEK